MDKSSLEQYGEFLAKEVDDLFVNGFHFDAHKHKRIIKECFVWIENSLLIVCFEEPQAILTFFANQFKIKVTRINNFKAFVWGLILKDEYKMKRGPAPIERV